MGDVADEIVRTNGSPADWKVRPELLYDWKPATGRGCPPYVPFTREKICRLLARRNVVMVGDGTQLLLHDVFLNNMYSLQAVDQMGNLEDAWERDGEPDCANEGHVLCSDISPASTFTFRVVHNNLLSADLPGGGKYNKRWIKRLLAWNASVVIINKGAELRPSASKRYIETLRDTMQLLRRLAPDVLVVFRSTWRGHVDCGRAEGPLKEVPGKGGATLPWDFAIDQNAAARAIMKEFGGVYLDIDTPLSMRPDGHLRKLSGAMDCYMYSSSHDGWGDADDDADDDEFDGHDASAAPNGAGARSSADLAPTPPPRGVRRKGTAIPAALAVERSFAPGDSNSFLPGGLVMMQGVLHGDATTWVEATVIWHPLTAGEAGALKALVAADGVYRVRLAPNPFSAAPPPQGHVIAWGRAVRHGGAGGARGGMGAVGHWGGGGDGRGRIIAMAGAAVLTSTLLPALLYSL
ncbi:unnamed protein product [Closterium sp. Yama58-4]|nr:unnamed protein product [Closterium sp. Yama58-4]